MSEELERKLRAALRPVDPKEGFADRVLARVERGEKLPDADGPKPPRIARAPLQRWSLALAASVALVAAFVGTHLWHEHREREAGLEAREQLIQALRVTSEKLDLAYDSVNREKNGRGPGA